MDASAASTRTKPRTSKRRAHQRLLAVQLTPRRVYHSNASESFVPLRRIVVYRGFVGDHSLRDVCSTSDPRRMGGA